MSDLIVMFPDQGGKGFRGEFGQRLMGMFAAEGAILMPILNGFSSQEEVELVVEEARRFGFMPSVSSETGLLAALVEGYNVATGLTDHTIVRLDTAEHPVSFIRTLAETAERIDGMAIGDLEFGPDTLKEGSLDEFAHLDIWPTLYGQYTQGKLPLSCAHGFQAFAPWVCVEILKAARDIVSDVEAELDASITWGFDGAMALAAWGLGIPVEIVKVPAEKMRDRPRQKIVDQFSNALRMCRAASRIED